VGVELGLRLAECGIRRSFVEVLLTVAAGGTSHDVNALEIEVANIGIGGIISQVDALEKVHIVEDPVILLAFQAAGTIPILAHIRPAPLSWISDCGF
jgi:hypothetical protein